MAIPRALLWIGANASDQTWATLAQNFLNADLTQAASLPIAGDTVLVDSTTTGYVMGPSFGAELAAGVLVVVVNEASVSADVPDHTVFNDNSSWASTDQNGGPYAIVAGNYCTWNDESQIAQGGTVGDYATANDNTQLQSATIGGHFTGNDNAQIELNGSGSVGDYATLNGNAVVEYGGSVGDFITVNDTAYICDGVQVKATTMTVAITALPILVNQTASSTYYQSLVVTNITFINNGKLYTIPGTGTIPVADPSTILAKLRGVPVTNLGVRGTFNPDVITTSAGVFRRQWQMGSR